MRVLGLMSGTSADGVDAVLAEFRGASGRPRWRLLEQASRPYPEDLRRRLIALGQGGPTGTAAILELAEAVTEMQADAARLCDPGTTAQLVGCHGQTVWHRAPEGSRRGGSWQLLQAPLLAHLLGRPVVHDFRAADLALGGQGAPLVPRCDAALLGRTGGWRAVVNLGGIANLTLIPPLGGPDRHADLVGWDCGPANSLIDLAVARFSDGRRRCDQDGAWAARGSVHEPLVAEWLQEPYFQAPPPKSTGRETFGAADLDRRLRQLQADGGPTTGADEAANALATLTAFAAAAVAADLGRDPRPVEVLVAGGGSRNATLMAELRRRSRGMSVRRTDEIGLPGQAREALAFALLAWWHLRRHPGSAAAVTGAAGDAVLGVLAAPPGRAMAAAVAQRRGR